MTLRGKSFDLTDITDSNSVQKGPKLKTHEYPSNRTISTTHINVTIPSSSPNSQTELLTKIGSKWNQIFATLAATLSAAGLGCVYAYTSTALQDLRNKQPFGPITLTQETWIGPLALAGGTVACPIAGYLLEVLGRRKTILTMMPLFVSGWIMIAAAQNMEMIYCGRFITGFCSGSITLAIPVFLSEMSDVSIRGGLTSCLDMMVTVGILYAYLVGTYVSWEIQALACAVMPLLCFLLMLIVPESPQFLLEMEQVDEAKKSLAWFRHLKLKEVETEFSQLTGSVAESLGKSSSWKDLLKHPTLKPISIGLTLMFVQQCSGIIPITAYAVDIFHSAGTDIDDNLSANIVGVIQVMATITSALLVDRCGRRLLLIFAQVFMVISMTGMGIFFYLKNHKDSVDSFSMHHLSWLPLTCLLIFVTAFSVGIGPISWVYMGEILPSQVKGKASGLITATSWLLSFVITLGFTGLMQVVGEAGGYWIFGGASLLGLIFIYFCVPETKGKSLEQIQSYFKS